MGGRAGERAGADSAQPQSNTSVFRAAPAGTLLSAPLDEFTAVHHRASGITHLLTSPAPEILAALGDEGATLDDLMARLSRDYALADADRAALSARLDELIAAGLVEAV